MAHNVFVTVSSKLAHKPKKNGRIHPLLGGLTLPERIAYQLEKQGVARVDLVNVGDPAEILSRTPGPKIDMRCHPGDSLFEAIKNADVSDDSTVMIVRGDRIYGAEILKAALSIDMSTFAGDDRDAEQNKPQSQAVVDAVDIVDKSEGSSTSVGITVVRRSAMDAVFGQGGEEEKSSGDENKGVFKAVYEQEELLKSAERKKVLVEKVVRDGFWHRVEEKADFKPARDALFKSLGKSIDGWVAKHFNRPVSQAVSKRIANYPFTPNQISAVVFLFGLSASALTLTGEWLWIAIGAVIFHFASVFDGIDGEIARVKFQSSKFGALLDSILDHIVLMAWVLAVAYVIHWRGGHIIYLISGWVVFWFTALGTAVVNYNQITTTKGGQPMELQWDFEKEEHKDKPMAKFVNSVRFLVGRDVDCVVLGTLAILNILKPIVIISVTVAVVYFAVVVGHQVKKILTKENSQPSAG